jgi:hypothetical protein
MHVATENVYTDAQQKANYQVAIGCYPKLQNVAKCQVDKETKQIKVIDLESKNVVTAFSTTIC